MHIRYGFPLALTALMVASAAIGAHAQQPTAQPHAHSHHHGADQDQTGKPVLTMHKNASCGCCSVWAERLRDAGIEVAVRDEPDMLDIKRKLGVPEGKYSCHTAEVGGYVIEGHVPADDIKRLLAERPKGKGLTVPGMPLGSPGMEAGDGRVEPYVVELFQADGSTSAYARHGRADAAP